MKKNFQQWMCRIGMALLAVVVSMGSEQASYRGH